jgi:hypothetical protein
MVVLAVRGKRGRRDGLSDFPQASAAGSAQKRSSFARAGEGVGGRFGRYRAGSFARHSPQTSDLDPDCSRRSLGFHHCAAQDDRRFAAARPAHRTAGRGFRRNAGSRPCGTEPRQRQCRQSPGISACRTAQHRQENCSKRPVYRRSCLRSGDVPRGRTGRLAPRIDTARRQAFRRKLMGPIQ